MNKNFNIIYFFDVLVYGLLAIVLSVLQTTLLPRLQIYNTLPDIVVGAVCYIGIYRGQNTSALFGLFSGLCVEALGSVGVSLLPLFYTLAGYVCGTVGSNAREKKRFSAFLISLPALCLARTCISFINYLINYFKTIELGQLFLYTLLPEFLYTLCLCIPAYLIARLFDFPLNAVRKGGGEY